MKKKITILLDEKDLKLIKKRAEERGASLSNYIESLLKQVAEKLRDEKKAFSSEEEKIIKNKLKNLGYFD